MGTATDSADQGRQVERTRLAWRRTTLGATVVALLAVGRGVHVGAGLATIVGLALAVAAWLVIVAVAHRRIGALTDRSTAATAAYGAPAAVALLAAALTLAGALLLG